MWKCEIKDVAVINQYADFFWITLKSVQREKW